MGDVILTHYASINFEGGKGQSEQGKADSLGKVGWIYSRNVK